MDESAIERCWWCGDDPQYVAYHDNEWGRPVTDDRRLFEKICLEGFQAGLSWLTILRKRENFRRAFSNFEIDTVARLGGGDVDRMLLDRGIVRHRGKIEAVINNARRAIDLIDQVGSLSSHVWGFAPTATGGHPVGGDGASTPVSVSAESTALSADLRRRGWRFVGPTTMYSFMQSMGLVNDHVAGCHAREECETERRALIGP